MSRGTRHQENAAREGLADFLDAALQNMPVGFCIWDDSLCLRLWNQAYLDIHRFEAHEIRRGMPLRDAIALSVEKGNAGTDDVEKRYKARAATFLKDRRGKQKVIKRPFSGGRTIEVKQHYVPDLGWVVVHEDITEKQTRNKIIRQRQKELRIQNMRLDIAVESIPHGLIMYDGDHRLITCNKTFAEMNHLDADLLMPGTPRELMKQNTFANGFASPEVTQEYFHWRDRVINTHSAGSFTAELAGGRVVVATHHPTPEGGWVLFQQDITELHNKQKLLEERSAELERQNERFDAAVNNMSHGLSMFDANHNLVICNEPYAAMYGLPEKLTRPGTSFWDMLDYSATSGMVSIADPGERRRKLEAEIAGGKPLKLPLTMLNGRIMSINHQPLPDGGWLATHEDITERHHSEEIIRHLARHDGLTGLANRTTFLEVLSEAQANSHAGAEMAVLCIDLDRFKVINDNLGHAAGDEVLRISAERLGKQVAKRGIVARLGGDEFAVLLRPLSSAQEAGEIAREICSSLAVPIQLNGLELAVGASVGIAVAPDHGIDPDTLMHNGDLALYSAKNGSRGGARFFEHRMDEMQRRRRSIEAGLKRAIAHDELRLSFQPLISLSENRISCCEALMRWTSAEHGAVDPMEFIAVAEESGLIREMGNWALRRACMEAAQWRDGVRVAVNVSPVQFKGNDFVVQVSSALEASGLSADRLELEITESLFLDDNEHNLEILHDLRLLGVRIALDDFGTGYSSLSYLRSFPFDKIKIDRSFIKELTLKSENMAIVKAVVQLAASLGMSTTAEGVETEAQLAMVRAQGCTEAQGYLFSPAVPQQVLTQLMRTTRNSGAELRAVS